MAFKYFMKMTLVIKACFKSNFRDWPMFTQFFFGIINPQQRLIGMRGNLELFFK